MKVIDLLNQIANTEMFCNEDKLPELIKYEDKYYSLCFEYIEDRYYICYAEENLPDDVWGELPVSTINLNDEIEIIDKINSMENK